MKTFEQAVKQKYGTFKAFADALDVTHAYIRHIRRGDRFPSHIVIERMAKALDVQPSTVFAWATGFQKKKKDKNNSE